jgi:hypothetical protein
MRFPSRKDKWTVWFFWAAALVCYALAAFVAFSNLSLESKIVFFLYASATGLFAQSHVTGTEYIIGQGQLKVKGGIFVRKTIPLDSIVKVEPVVSREAAPALSGRRLRIHYGRWNHVDVSPEREEEFLEKLKEAAPHVRTGPVKAAPVRPG